MTFQRLLQMMENGHISKIHIQNIVHKDHVLSEAVISTPNHTYRMPIGNVDTFKSKVEAMNNRGGFKVPLT